MRLVETINFVEIKVKNSLLIYPVIYYIFLRKIVHMLNDIEDEAWFVDYKKINEIFTKYGTKRLDFHIRYMGGTKEAIYIQILQINNFELTNLIELKLPREWSDEIPNNIVVGSYDIICINASCNRRLEELLYKKILPKELEV